MIHSLKDFSKVLDWHTAVITLLALLSTYLCRQLNYITELPDGLIGIAVIFPLVFSINSAYRRREDALHSFANFKTSAVALYYAHRDWPPTDREESTRRGFHLVEELLNGLATHFKSGENGRITSFAHMYSLFSEVSRSLEIMRQTGVPANEISGANQILRTMVFEFERMNNISNYRTPIALRAYSRLFLNFIPILFGPHFAHTAYPTYPVLGYLVAVLYAIVLVSLDNIQDQLENPFDGIGGDDLRVNLTADYLNLLT